MIIDDLLHEDPQTERLLNLLWAKFHNEPRPSKADKLKMTRPQFDKYLEKFERLAEAMQQASAEGQAILAKAKAMQQDKIEITEDMERDLNMFSLLKLETWPAEPESESCK